MYWATCVRDGSFILQLVTFEPENEIETLIDCAKRGTGSIADVLAHLTKSDLFISSKREVQRDGSGFEPLLLGQAQAPLVAAFTAASRPALHRHAAEYLLQMPGAQFLARLPHGYGVILNPGYTAQLIIADHVVANLRGRR